MWLDAAIQIFYSLGVAYGSLIAFSSYNPIKHDSTKDAITVCLINCATSIYASVVVFCFIGFQVIRNVDIFMLIDSFRAMAIKVNKMQLIFQFHSPSQTHANVNGCNFHSSGF